MYNNQPVTSKPPKHVKEYKFKLEYNLQWECFCHLNSLGNNHDQVVKSKEVIVEQEKM